VKIKNEKIKDSSSLKEIEVFNSITIEVNATSIKSTLYTDYTVREQSELSLTTIRYHGNSAKELKSKYGHTKGDKFYLDENVTLLQESGYRYKAQHAIYDQSIDIFYVTSPFVGYINRSVIKGVNLKYDIKEKIATAQKIDAVFYTGKDR
jgi:actin-related protein